MCSLHQGSVSGMLVGRFQNFKIYLLPKQSSKHQQHGFDVFKRSYIIFKMSSLIQREKEIKSDPVELFAFKTNFYVFS